MKRRILCLWLPAFRVERAVRDNPALAAMPFAVCAADHGRDIVLAINQLAQASGVLSGMSLADARALAPNLFKVENAPDRDRAVLLKMADWAQRYTPIVGLCGEDGLWLDIAGCAHLYGGEEKLLDDLHRHFLRLGYVIRAAIADTMGAAWALAHYGKQGIAASGGEKAALGPLPPVALRLSDYTAGMLLQLGLRRVSDLLALPRSSLLRRFGAELLLKFDQALGETGEKFRPHHTDIFYSVKAQFPEPLATAESIAAVLKNLLDELCVRLLTDGRGIRRAYFIICVVDGSSQHIGIGTGSPCCSPKHLFRLFEDRLCSLAPGFGIETFLLTAPVTEKITAAQKQLFHHEVTDSAELGELADRLRNRLGARNVYRVLPVASHWPERAIKRVASLAEEPQAPWSAMPRPVTLLAYPEPIEVMAPVPDYPPLLFRHGGILRRISRAEGPERIEREWWQAQDEARDYFRIEDVEGIRYWVFRQGHYRHEEPSRWFLHGYFA